MGGSDSKQEEPIQNNDIQKKQQIKNSPFNSKNASKKNSPRSNDNANQNSIAFPKQVIKQKNSQKNYNNKIESNEKLGNSQLSDEIISKSNNSPQKQQLLIFDHFQSKFHQNSSIDLIITIINIRPSNHLVQNLYRQKSTHNAKLQWQYEQKKVKNKKMTFLHFSLIQDDGYQLHFLIGNNGQVYEGDQQIWNFICPYRQNSNKEQIKVGSYICQRSYEMFNNPKIQQEEDPQIDISLYQKWNEKPPNNHDLTKKKLKKKVQTKIKDQVTQYRETGRYFFQQKEISFSVLIEEKFNSFRCWLIDYIGNIQHSSQTHKSMGITLLNDSENRQNIYIQEMKTKRKKIVKKIRK